MKRIHAYNYIKTIAESDIVDRSAYQGHENDVYLPYRQVLSFFGEYEYYCIHYNVPKCERASESTFRRALSAVQRDMKRSKGVTVRLSGGKGESCLKDCSYVSCILDGIYIYLGSFERCEICANADILLQQYSRKSPEEREIIKEYRRLHILQQFDERVKLQNNIEKTRVCDENGQPTCALLFNDAMTATKGIWLM